MRLPVKLSVSLTVAGEPDCHATCHATVMTHAKPIWHDFMLVTLVIMPSSRWQFLFHVLRTYRHAAGEKRKAEVNAKARALHL